jgi:hypothetical protein
MSYRSARSRRSNRVECLYCGPSPALPPGYDGFGSGYQCLRKGVGVGKFGERRSWQRRMGYPVDPEYKSHCPRLPARRGNRSRSSGSSSDESDYPNRRSNTRSNRRGALSMRHNGTRLTRITVSRSGRYQYDRRSNNRRPRPGPRSRNRRSGARSQRSGSRSRSNRSRRRSNRDFSWF